MQNLILFSFYGEIQDIQYHFFSEYPYPEKKAVTGPMPKKTRFESDTVCRNLSFILWTCFGLCPLPTHLCPKVCRDSAFICVKQ